MVINHTAVMLVGEMVVQLGRRAVGVLEVMIIMHFLPRGRSRFPVGIFHANHPAEQAWGDSHLVTIPVVAAGLVYMVEELVVHMV